MEMEQYQGTVSFVPIISLTPTSFKAGLGKCLNTIPDQPTIQGLNKSANSNLLVDQISCKC